MIEYKGFLIDPVETTVGGWRAKIRRPDGRKVKVVVTGLEHDSPTTGAERIRLLRAFRIV
jgi:hypothetical protein